MKKILAYGYIPKEKGGKQTTGLATGIFDLHDAVNAENLEFEIIIAATDIHTIEINIDNTRVIGWNKKILIKYTFIHLVRIIYFIIHSFLLFSKFHKLVPFFKTLVKLIFLDYAIEKTKPDLIHFHGTYGALLSTGLYYKHHKLILRIHGINGFNSSIEDYYNHNNIERYITKLKFIKVTFVTNSILKEWKESYGCFSCEMIPILNGYNPLLFFPDISNKPVQKKYDLITISGISENKGQIRVIEAMIELKQNGLQFTYLIVGHSTPEYLCILKNKIYKHKLNVTFIDYLPQMEINKYIHQSKFFILPSFSEGFGKVYIESIGAGVPVIIPKHLPISNEVGILTEENSIFITDSSIKSISEALLKIFQNPPVYIDQKVSNTVKTLKWCNLAKQYIEIYKSILYN